MTQYHRTINYRWCWQVWLTTSLVLLFLVAIIVGFAYAVFVKGDMAGFTLLLIFAMLLGATLLCEGYSPQRLEVDDVKIVVLRRYASVVLYRRNIKAIRPLSDHEMHKVVSIGGCMGIFGFFGSFRNKVLGDFKMYATSFEHLYLIELFNGERIVVGSDADNVL